MHDRWMRLCLSFSGAWLVLLLVCLCEMGARSAEIARHLATTPMVQTEEAADWMERHEALNALSKVKETRLVFLGDSITEMWESDEAGKPTWKKYWFPLKAANFGIHGDRTEHVLWRLEHGNLDGLSPKVME